MNEQATQQQVLNKYTLGKLTPAAKPKPWTELGIEEKVERLREAIVRLRWGATSQSQSLCYLTEQVERLGDHSHDAQGRALVPMRHRYGAGGVAQAETACDPLA